MLNSTQIGQQARKVRREFHRGIRHQGKHSLTCTDFMQLTFTQENFWSSPAMKISKLDEKFRIIKPTRCVNFSILFWNETLHVSDSSSVHHQEFFTVHTAMIYVSLQAVRKPV